MYSQFLTEIETIKIKGGGEPIKPIPQPRDRYDDEEQAQSFQLSNFEEALNWREWLKKWLGKDK